ncbi:uncharacterized protein YecA (UPF0149 family) [Elusimicrobium posterum]|uniref:SEC-C metal-binding domain-containing protein n=1 Tax=Elusimicrobium posterum TaxID=3116653 RepID=UPI003C791E59
MIWNPFKKKEETTAAKTEGAKADGKKESIEERIEREIASLPGPIKKQMSNPQVKERFIEIAKRMEKDGVDFKNIRQMKKWIKTHEAELKAEQAGGEAGPKIETVRKAEGEDIGRNDPCTCGSGKKYKKCCGK